MSSRSAPTHHFDQALQDLTTLYAEVNSLFTAYREAAGSSDQKQLREVMVSIQDKLTHRRFRVAVVALVKTGKSTFLNGLLGANLLPVSNVPETARLVEIEHAEIDPPVLQEKREKSTVQVAQGAERIQEALKKANASVRRHQVPSTHLYVLKAPFVGLKGRSLAGDGFVVYDTPGPNEAGALSLSQLIERTMNDADVILYLLDYTKLNTEDETRMLSLLRERRELIAGGNEGRLFFVVNKYDEFFRNPEGMDAEGTKAYVARKLTEALGKPVSSNRIWVTSARQALMARLMLAPEAPPLAVRAAFAREAFGHRDPARIPEADYFEEAERMVHTSGFDALEQAVMDHLYGHGGGILLRSVASDLLRVLQGLRDQMRIVQASAGKTKQDLQDERLRIEAAVLSAHARLKKLEESVPTARLEMKSKAIARQKQFQASLIGDLRVAFGREPRDPEDPHLLALKSEIAQVLARNVGTKDENEVKDRAQKINDVVSSYTKASFGRFRRDLEYEAFVEQQKHVNRITAEVSNISADLRSAIGREIKIKLSARPFKAHNVTMSEVQKAVQDANVFQGEGRADKIRNSFCWPDGVYHYTVYKIDADLLLEEWISALKEGFGNSEVAIGNAVAKLGARPLEMAAEQMNDQADEIRAALDASLALKERSAAEQAERARQTTEDLETIEHLLGRVRPLCDFDPAYTPAIEPA